VVYRNDPTEYEFLKDTTIESFKNEIKSNKVFKALDNTGIAQWYKCRYQLLAHEEEADLM